MGAFKASTLSKEAINTWDVCINYHPNSSNTQTRILSKPKVVGFVCETHTPIEVRCEWHSGVRAPINKGKVRREGRPRHLQPSPGVACRARSSKNNTNKNAKSYAIKQCTTHLPPAVGALHPNSH